MIQTPHNDEDYFDITSSNIPPNDAGKAPEKAKTRSWKDILLKKVAPPTEPMNAPEPIDIDVVFDVSAGAAPAGKSPKPEKNVPTPQFVSAPKDSGVPLEIDDNTHEIDDSDVASEIDDDTHEIDVSHFDVTIGGKKDSKPGAAHRKIPVAAVYFPEHSHEQEVGRDIQNLIDVEFPITVVMDTLDSQAFLEESVFKERALDSEGMHGGSRINESGKIDIPRNASGPVEGSKDARSHDNKGISFERSAIQSIQRAMSESQFFPPGNEILENPPPPPAPDRFKNTLTSDSRSGIRDRVEKVYSELVNKINASRDSNDAEPPAGNTAAVSPANQKNALPFSKSPNSKTPFSKAMLEIETSVFKASVIETSEAPNYIIFVLQGRFDQDQKQFESFLEQVIALKFQKLICDMRGLQSMSSSGWGILIAQFQRLKKHGGNLCLCGMNGEVEQCFRVLELDKLFSSYQSVTEAISALRRETQKEPRTASDEPDASALTLDDKIKRIISENPNYSVGEILKLLKSDEFGRVKISGWSLQAKLRTMNLGTKDDRYRFFRST